MRRSSVALAWALIAGLLVVAPARAQDPVLEIHRTEAGAHWDPRGTDLLFVLVIGSDVREGDPARGRADTLRLIALNPATMQGSTVGIPRDSYVNIPGRGMSKINASLQFGGPQLVVETVQALAGVPIHFWALVEFSRFRQLVDRLGGVTVNVPYPMNDRFSGANFP
ncbi:MAG TPA: LCP family protein, partial [Actinomycetota bacterium]|nr:LCP family protein [Actinomycetota bacterium]